MDQLQRARAGQRHAVRVEGGGGDLRSAENDRADPVAGREEQNLRGGRGRPTQAVHIHGELCSCLFADDKAGFVEYSRCIAYHTMQCHATPHHTISCHAIPHLTIPYHTVPYRMKNLETAYAHEKGTHTLKDEEESWFRLDL